MSARTSYIDIIRLILRQAAFDPVAVEIPEVVRQRYNDLGGSSGEAASLSLESAYTLLSRILASGIKLRVIIDALDECNEPKKLLKIFRDISDKVPGALELLVTSRHQVQVTEKFQDCPKIDLNNLHSAADMLAFIQTEVKERDKDERLLGGDYSHLEDGLIDILYKRAGGMYVVRDYVYCISADLLLRFRWVQLQLSLFFSDPPLSNPGDVSDELEKLKIGTVAREKELNAAYGDIYERNAPGKRAKHHAEKLYKLLLCCKAPLRITFLAQALPRFRCRKYIRRDGFRPYFGQRLSPRLWPGKSTKR